MFSSKTLLNTSHIIEKIHCEWTIEDFGVLFDMKAIDSNSRSFPNDRSDFKYCLGLYLSSESNTLNVQLIPESKFSRKCSASVWVKGHNITRKFSCFTTQISKDFELMGIDFFNKERKNLLINDKLVICCDITVLEVICFLHSTQPNIPNCTLVEEIGALLDTKELADLTIITDDDKIPVHKNILSARSKVFAAMFKHSMKENAENCVTISDISSVVVKEMLRFIYTGEAPNLKDMAVDLMAAAEKYGLDRLKAMCARSMSDNLSIETAPIVLKAADLYNLEDLKFEAVKFIESNLGKVTETPIWKDIITTDRKLILESFFKQKFLEFKLSDDNSSSDEEEEEEKSVKSE